MPWAPRSGAPGNSNHFMASGNGRDTFILSSPEFQHGRLRLTSQRFDVSGDGVACRRRRTGSGPTPPSEKRLRELHTGTKTSLGRAKVPSTLELILRRSESEPLPLTAASGTRSEVNQHRLPHVRERPLLGVNGLACFFSDPVSTLDCAGSFRATIAGPGAF